MSSKGLYFNKQKHSSQHEGRRDKELPSQIMKQYLMGQERVKPRATPRTTEELLYRQRLQENVKPPSVKMAEEEERKRKEEERKAEEARKEARMEDIAKATKTLPALAKKLIEETEAKGENPPSYETLLTPAERQRAFVPEEKDIEKELGDASKTQPLSKNLNNLFNTPRSKTTTGIKVINKLSADGLKKALKNADDNGRVLDAEFKKAIRNIIRLKVSGSSKA